MSVIACIVIALLALPVISRRVDNSSNPDLNTSWAAFPVSENELKDDFSVRVTISFLEHQS